MVRDNRLSSEENDDVMVKPHHLFVPSRARQMCLDKTQQTNDEHWPEAGDGLGTPCLMPCHFSLYTVFRQIS